MFGFVDSSAFVVACITEVVVHPRESPRVEVAAIFSERTCFYTHLSPREIQIKISSDQQFIKSLIHGLLLALSFLDIQNKEALTEISDEITRVGDIGFYKFTDEYTQSIV
ncbi:uncharacterized protein PHALS_05254 [Plasmopara halstedii]|uniref:Uncharacterized protein n=1 Tax=Plasmopara halstedii TaxID=4781 RepID=A0A0N7L7T0_PLAHL|nr:uncharacterized protein PHALS_05254 [Plasmopara halstedii]CEG47931.1 hypothetical protein PHALS_05254 [Plasmopara halstedii]|eukprot:XP_024584300.1 hypothetical protein PHALS_05254 [Plasmopara halstedii]